MSKITICLTMIIRNESQIIRRCLESVKSMCDYMTICDTGSTDNTCEIVSQFFEENPQIDCRLYHHKWKDFGHNRSLSLSVARKTNAIYILCIDADMIMEIKPNFDKKSLCDDVYDVNQKNSTIIYPNRRLLRSNLEWKCVGVTHEYYDVGLGYPLKIGFLDTLLINDLNDGGCKSDKFERDIRLLTQGLIDEPNNARYMFYLAESYYNTQQYEQCLKWYTNRINAGGFPEEIYYSYYKIAKTYIQQKKPWKDIRDAFVMAYKHTPKRAEPLYELAKYCRDNKLFKEGYYYAKIGAKNPFPLDLKLFISHQIYEYLMVSEVAVNAYYIGEYKECLKICLKLVANPNIPKNDIMIFKQNIYFSAYQLANFYRNSKLYAKGYKYANIGLDYVGDHNYMIYKLSIELAICAHYIGKFRQSLKVYDYLLEQKLVPDCDVGLIKRNSKFSSDQLLSLISSTKPLMVIYTGTKDLTNLSKCLTDCTKYYHIHIFGTYDSPINIPDVNLHSTSELGGFIGNINILIILDLMFVIQYPINANKTFVMIDEETNLNLLSNIAHQVTGVITFKDDIDLSIEEDKMYHLDPTHLDVSVQLLELLE